MPVYEYKCQCGQKREVTLKMGERPDIPCLECGATMGRFLTGGSGSFVKGPTPTKYYLEDRRRKKRNAELGVKQFERYGGQNKLVPNVNGEEVGSWKEARQIAEARGVKDTRKFHKYEQEEANSRNSANLNEKRLKALKEKARLL